MPCAQVEESSPGSLFPSGPVTVQLLRSFQELVQFTASQPESPRLAVLQTVLQWQQRLQDCSQPSSWQERRDMLQARVCFPDLFEGLPRSAMLAAGRLLGVTAHTHLVSDHLARVCIHASGRTRIHLSRRLP